MGCEICFETKQFPRMFRSVLQLLRHYCYGRVIVTPGLPAYARCEVTPKMRDLISTFFAPMLAVWGIFYIFAIWVLWMIVKSLKGIDVSLKAIAAKPESKS